MSLGCRSQNYRIGVLLAQLGTPDAPTPAALRRYLAQFLSDRRVIELNRIVWWCILHGIILRTRPRRSAALYSRVWTSDGSPLLQISLRCRDKLEQLLRQQYPQVDVAIGMRYGNPSLTSALDQLIARGCSRILLFPMYPQYAAATTASTYDMVFPYLLKQRWVPTLRVVDPYFRDPAYLAPLANQINETLSAHRDIDKLIVSYHGVPERYVEKGDPYCCMCTETTQALLPQLDLPAEKIVQTFQSRFGREPWLRPYTDDTVEGLAEGGAQKIAVVCPGFTADCLETIDEIGHEAREQFQEAGGKDLLLVPCLNDRPDWIEGMAKIACREMSGWLDTMEESAPLRCPWAAARAAEQQCQK